MTCNDLCPWVSEISCQRPTGHDGLHRVADLDWNHRWSDSCHFEDDDCPPGTHTANHRGRDMTHPPRKDVYVRCLNVLREGLRTQEVADGIYLDWWTDKDGVEHVSGVEILQAKGVEIDGEDAT